MTPRETESGLVTYLLGRSAFGALGLLPTRMARALGRRLGLLFFRISARHRQIARRNLALAFGPALDETRIGEVAQESFAHLGLLAADAPQFARHAKAPLERIAVYEGVEHLRSAASEGKGVLVFSGHYGDWELTALLQARIGIPMTMVVAPMRNARFDRYFARLRGLTGNTILSKRQAARPILKALKSGGAVAILIDQNVRGEGGLFVSFFGREASTTPSPATLAFRSGAPLVPVFSRFLPDGRLLISYREPLRPARTATLEEDIRALTQTMSDILEAEIRRHPGCWLWMHDRWRTRPRSESAAPGTAPLLAAAPGASRGGRSVTG